MKPLSEKVSSMPQSGIRRVQWLINNQPKELQEKCIRLETGEPNFITAPYILEGAKEAMADGFTKYTHIQGIPSVRQAIADEYSARFHRPVDKDSILVTTGAVMAINLALRVIAKPGDEILVPDPSWPTVYMELHDQGLKKVSYLLDPDNNYAPSEKEIRSKITDKTVAIYVNSPSNPTGVVYTQETISMIYKIAHEYDLYIISDEIYDFLTYDGHKAISFKADDPDDRVIVINGASKKYAMTGWRVGSAYGNPDVIFLMTQLMIVDGGNCCSVAQKAYEAAIKGPQDFVQECIDAYSERRNAVLSLLNKNGIPVQAPQGAFYAWIDTTPTGLDGEEFSSMLMSKYNVAVIAGITFGESGKNRIRISLATDYEDLMKGTECICLLMKSLMGF